MPKHGSMTKLGARQCAPRSSSTATMIQLSKWAHDRLAWISEATKKVTRFSRPTFMAEARRIQHKQHGAGRALVWNRMPWWRHSFLRNCPCGTMCITPVSMIWNDHLCLSTMGTTAAQAFLSTRPKSARMLHHALPSHNVAKGRRLLRRYQIPGFGSALFTRYCLLITVRDDVLRFKHRIFFR